MTTQDFAYQFRNHAATWNLPVRLLGVRGYRRDMGDPSGNDIGLWDDLIFREINGHIDQFPANTDPSWWYIHHPINDRGCARLRCGLWWYEQGLHRGRLALTQADGVAVDRLDRHGNLVSWDHGYFGINIHPGLRVTGLRHDRLVDEVGRWSAGCQLVQGDDAADNAYNSSRWHDFLDPIINAMRVHNQRRVPYLLVETLEAAPC